MKDNYFDAFYGVVKESQEKTGYDLPENIECYVVMLLANYIDKPDFLPEESFAQSYLKLKSPYNYDAKELGDTCLFVTGVFPAFGKKIGLDRKYYQNIGISSYDMISESLNGQLFSQLSAHFVFLSDFIELTIHSSKDELNILFR